MNNEIIIPAWLIERILLRAAEQEVSVEEIVTDAIRKYISERRDNIGE